MLARIYAERGLTLRHMTYSDARDMIEIRKGVEDPEYYLDMIDMDLETLHHKYLDAVSTRDIIFYGYLYEEKKCFGLDYNDLIFFTLYIFEQNPEIRRKWQERLQYIMVDEFQDIDKPQYRLMRALCGYHKNLFIVGDPDQTIYTWRGASVKYLLDFDREFPRTKTIMMMQNYRSTPEILAAANSLIAQNRNRMKKELTPTLPSGAPVVWMHCESPEDEAGRIAERIMALHDKGVPYRDMTLLYLGSSRIAWGASKSSSAADLDNADRLTNVYMAKLLEGYTAGEAFYMARQSFFDYNDGYFTPHQALTIVEFNLFGDPFLHVGVRREGAKAHPRAVKALAKGAVNAVVERKCVYEAAPASLLDRVRSAVDRNLSLIRAAVDRQLYEQLGVEPRSLSTVTRMKYGNGDEFYAFNYLQTDGTIKSCHTATADLKGNVKSIISTK